MPTHLAEKIINKGIGMGIQSAALLAEGQRREKLGKEEWKK